MQGFNAALHPALLSLLTGFLASLCLTFLLSPLALRLGFVSVAKKDRWKQETIPLLGGVAVLAGTALGFFTAYLSDGGASWEAELKPLSIIICGSFLAMAIGLVDDKYRLFPQTKLIAQILLAIALVSLGFRINITGILLIDSLLSLFWITMLMNAFNLMDNMDGLASGIASIASFFLLALYFPQAETHAGRILLLAGFLGSCLGFLIRNFPPAKIFLGDAGSLFIGFFLSSLATLEGNGDMRSLTGIAFAPTLLLLIPIFDMIFVSLNRLLHGRSPFVGGRDHTSHRLVIAGLSERKATFIFYLLAFCGGILTLVSYNDPSTLTLSALLFCSMLGMLAVYLSQIQVYNDKQESKASGKPSFSVISYIPYKRQGLCVLLDTGLIAAAYFASHILRFEDQFHLHLEILAKTMPLALFIQLSALWVSGIYKSSFRHSSIHDLLAILKGTSLGVGTTMLAVLLVWRFHGFSRSLFLIDFVLLVSLITSFRLAFRLLDHVVSREKTEKEALTPVLIYGAGDQGETVARTLFQNHQLGKKPIGFVDDDENKIGLSIHGLRVWGGLDRLEWIMTQLNAKEIIISTSKVDGVTFDQIKQFCRENNVTLKLPVWNFELVN